MDADAVQTVVARVRHLAGEVSRLAGSAAATSAVGWQSVAATRWRQRLADEVGAMRRLSAALDDAASALARHVIAAGSTR
jgi:hypothetical protein